MRIEALRMVAPFFVLVPCAVGATPSAVSAPQAAAASYSNEISASKSNMMQDPAAALQHSMRAVALADDFSEPGVETRLATGLWLQAEALTRLNKVSEAEPLVDRAIAMLKLERNKLRGDLLMTRAAIAGSKGDVQSALRDLTTAYAIFQEIGDGRGQALALHDLGSLYTDAGDWERVLRYYRQSSAIYEADPVLRAALHNNMGFAFREMGRPGDAEAEFLKALALLRGADSPLLVARILTNIASVQLLQSKVAAAEQTVKQAFELTKAGEAAGWRRFVLGVKGDIAAARGQHVLANRFFTSAFHGLDLSHTEMPFRDFHKGAYQAARATGDLESALSHLAAFHRLQEQAQELRASTNAALLGAQFDFTRQQLQIAKLKQQQLSNNVLLAQAKTRMLYGALATAVVTLLLGGIALLAIRRSRNNVRAMNVELNQANEALERALKAKTEFLATTSHEIRTPLNGILGVAQTMLLSPRLEPEVRENIDLIKSAGDTMKALVDDLLDVAKLETGTVIPDLEKFAIDPVLAAVVKTWEPLARQKNIQLSVELGNCRSDVVSDRRRIQQIVFNLVSNAIKFTDVGSVTVSTGTTQSADGDRLWIKVSDTGIGIPKDELGRIFDSFHQVDSTTTRRHGGTGLGLAICRDLIKMLGGTISVESELGVGSTFTLTLPVAPAENHQSSRSPEQNGMRTWNADGFTGAALIISNNPLTQSFLRMAIKELVQHVQVVSDVADAIVAGPEGWACVIVDEGDADEMNDVFDIADFAERISAPILLLRKRSEGPASKWEDAAAKVLPKPVSPKLLCSTLAALLDPASGIRLLEYEVV